ncbi:MAG: hypothetical protein CM1200mP18_04600 [Gammaproteobacteria bacterium]|nr:MAG: hypothetical protein CM1200mP18_04600 [Gammaproteobacteria bacterium]
MAAIGRTALEYWYLVARGNFGCCFGGLKETLVGLMITLNWECLASGRVREVSTCALRKMHPNWSVYQKKFQQALGIACPGLSMDAAAYVLDQFDGCYEFDDGFIHGSIHFLDVMWIRRVLMCRWWVLLKRDHLYGFRAAEGVDELSDF